MAASSLPVRLLPWGVWLGIGVLWGTTWAVIRVGLRDVPPFTFAAMRTVLAAATLLVLAQLLRRGRRPLGREWRFWIAVGLPQIAVPYALIFWAEQYVSSGLTAMLFATFPAFTAVAAHFLLRNESLTVAKTAGTLLALVAVAFLVGPSPAERPPIGAVGAVLLASMSSALGAVIVRRHGQSTSTMWLTAIQLGAAAVFLAALALTMEWGQPVHFTATSIASVLYLAWAISVGCYLGLFWLLKRVDATLVSMGVIFETAVGVFLGAFLFDERLGAEVFAGLALVGLSIYLVTLKRRGAATIAP